MTTPSMVGARRGGPVIIVLVALAVGTVGAASFGAARLPPKTSFGVETRAVLDLFEKPYPKLIHASAITRIPAVWPDFLPPSLTFGAGSRWFLDVSACEAQAATRPCPEIVRVDAASGAMQARIAVATIGLAFGESGLWALGADDCALTLLDPTTNEPARRVEVPGGCERDSSARSVELVKLFAAADSLWVVYGSKLVKRIDATSGELLASITLRNQEVALTADGDGLWLAAHGAVERIDHSNNLVTRVAVFGDRRVQSLAVDPRFVWVTTFTGYESEQRDLDLLRIDRATGVVTPTGLPVEQVAVGAGGLWFLGYHPAGNSPDGNFSSVTVFGRIDPTSFRVKQVSAFLASAAYLAGTDDAAWIARVDTTGKRQELVRVTR